MARHPRVSLSEMAILKLSWMSKPCSPQIIHFSKLIYLHTSGFKVEGYARLRRGCRALIQCLNTSAAALILGTFLSYTCLSRNEII